MNNHELDELRSQVIEAVRVLFDRQQSELLNGKGFDAQRLLMTIELLTRLLPQAAAEPAPEPSHGGREKLEKLFAAQEPEPEKDASSADLHAEIARLTHEVDRLRQQQAQPTPATPEPKAATIKEPWTVPKEWKREGQPVELWREWLVGGDLTMRRVRHSDWGPI